MFARNRQCMMENSKRISFFLLHLLNRHIHIAQLKVQRGKWELKLAFYIIFNVTLQFFTPTFTHIYKLVAETNIIRRGKHSQTQRDSKAFGDNVGFSVLPKDTSAC